MLEEGANEIGTTIRDNRERSSFGSPDVIIPEICHGFGGHIRAREKVFILCKTIYDNENIVNLFISVTTTREGNDEVHREMFSSLFWNRERFKHSLVLFSARFSHRAEVIRPLEGPG
jgi:hypothetical protein